HMPVRARAHACGAGATASERGQALGLVGVAFGAVLGQSNSIVMGGRPVTFRVTAVESGVTAFGPVAAVPVFVFSGQQLGAVVVVLPLVGGNIAGIGGGVTLVGGVQDCLGGLTAPRQCALPGRHFGLPGRHFGLASFEVVLALSVLFAHGGSQPPQDESVVCGSCRRGSPLGC